MTNAWQQDRLHAPRFVNGEYLGRFPADLVRDITDDALLVRFQDGHLAACFLHELF